VGAEVVAWEGAGTKRRSFEYVYSGAATRVAPAFFLPYCPLSCSQGLQLAAPVFPR
jgi:hypothetical protein